MKLVLKHLKPFALLVTAAVVLLVAQAFGDLNQPNLMSNIVNVGLQGSGIAEDAPRHLTQEGMDFLTAFMTPEDEETFREAYVSPITKEALETRSMVFPAMFIYNNWDINTPVNADIYGRAVYFFMQKAMAMLPEQEDQAGFADIDIEQVYALGRVLAAQPGLQEELEQFNTLDLDPGLYGQMGKAMIRVFYEDAGIDVAQMQRSYIYRTGAVMVLVALGSGLAAACVVFLSARISAGFSRNLRRTIFMRVQAFSKVEIDKFSIASLITRSTNDVQQVQMIMLMGIRMIVFAPVMGVGGIIMALRKSIGLSWIIVLAMLVMILTLLLALFIVLPKFKSLQGLIDKLNLVSRENLTGLMVVRAFGNEQHEEQRFEQAARIYAKTERFVNRSMAIMMPFLLSVLMNGLQMMIVWFGARAIEASTLQIGDMMAFMQYAMQIVFSFLFVAMLFVMLPRAAVSAGRIKEVLDTPVSIHDPEQPVELSQDGAEVAFNNVHFRYKNAEEDVLENISFIAKPGQTTAFIGATGAGKSTLVHLLERFYDVTSGSIKINNIDIRDMQQSELRRQIGFVPQKAVLFSGSIRSNVAYGSACADEAVREAISIAQAEDFVSEQEEGLGHNVDQGGANLSGGQKQRLSIARALARKPKIYIFDDSFSALDFKTDAALRRALKEHTGGATVFIIAQRVSTIMNAEQIIVLDEGKIAGIGTHKELLGNCVVYREIAESQLSWEELSNG